MPNYLIHENSPYLLQHANNPVEWYPWGPEALEKARLEEKPIFLSVGYAACHWCHVMAHESFEDLATAVIMNKHFVNIKVDREERPDLDSIYMNAVVAMTGQGGWPMSVFLTPDLQPFYGGTYYPPLRRYNMPSFQEVLLGVARAWQNSRQEILTSGEKLTQHLTQASTNQAGQTSLGRVSLERAAMALSQGYDWQQGGWGKAPKFPQPMTIEFLLRRARDGDSVAREMAVHALQAMSRGGMYDVVGGGFARYSTDNQWLVPHFEKMLYDNAQLALVYLHGYMVCRDAPGETSDTTELRSSAQAFKRVCMETLDFIQRELYDPQGGFYSSLDADSEGEEGKYYVWKLAEIRQALEPADADFFIAAYNVTEKGNFEGHTVLQRALTDQELADRFDLKIDQVPPRLQACHARLFELRSQRLRPATDDKVLTSWNALALAAFAEASRYLNRPDYLEVARRNAHFLLSALQGSSTGNEPRLLRSWRAGRARHNAYLEDYGALILGLLALYQSDPDVQWYIAAVKLATDMVAAFLDPQGGGFYDTRLDHENLLVRPRDIQDNATPSGGALATLALLQLSAYSGRGDWRDLAVAALSSVQQLAMRYPTGFACWLLATDFAVSQVKEAALIGSPDDPRTMALESALWSAWRPRLVAAVSPFPPPPGSPELLNDRPMVANQPAAYICQQFACLVPLTSTEGLLASLD